MVKGDTYGDLARLCRKRKLRLLLCGDRDHGNRHGASTKLTRLEVRKKDELMVRVSLKKMTLDEAAVSALNALELQDIK